MTKALPLRVADVLAPTLAARLAYRLWFRLPASGAAMGKGEQDAPAGVPELLASPFEVRVRGRAIRGWVWGDGPVVYLVHGWGGRLEQLSPLVRHLLARRLQVVAFDGLSHGSSDAGRHGPRSSDAVELGRSLDAVAARFGPARAVVAHSMGALSTLLALRDGWLGAERLVLIAPSEGVPDFLERFRRQVGFSRRTERRLIAMAERRTGYSVDDLDPARLGAQLQEAPELLVIHDLEDRQTAHGPSARLVAGWPGGQLYTTNGLGHRRILADNAVGGAVARFAARFPVELPLHADDRPAPFSAAVGQLEQVPDSVA